MGMIIIRSIKHYCFHFLKFIFSFINWFQIKATGELEKPRPYEKSAQVSKVFGCFSYHFGPFTRPNFDKTSFLYLHERFTHPEIVLNDSISLYNITSEEAIFVDCGRFDIFADLPSTIQAQEREVLKIITLPIHSFNLIASQIPISKAKLVHIANHGRCGSTLMQKILMQVPNTLPITSSLPLANLVEFSRVGTFNEKELRVLATNTIKCYMKHANFRDSKIICLEDYSISIFVIDILFETWPNMKHIYLFRQPVPFTRSWEKLQIIHQWCETNMHMFKSKRGIGHKILSDCPIYDDDFLKSLSPFGKFAMIWIAYNAVYKRIVSKGYPIVSVKFEDFIENPKKTMLGIFSYFEIPAEYLPDVKKILSVDSQKGNYLSSQNVDQNELKRKLTPLTEEVIKEVDIMCKDYKVPLFWNDDIYLENNISNQPKTHSE